MNVHAPWDPHFRLETHRASRLLSGLWSWLRAYGSADSGPMVRTARRRGSGRSTSPNPRPIRNNLRNSGRPMSPDPSESTYEPEGIREGMGGRWAGGRGGGGEGLWEGRGGRWAGGRGGGGWGGGGWEGGVWQGRAGRGSLAGWVAALADLLEQFEPSSRRWGGPLVHTLRQHGQPAVPVRGCRGAVRGGSRAVRGGSRAVAELEQPEVAGRSKIPHFLLSGAHGAAQLLLNVAVHVTVSLLSALLGHCGGWDRIGRIGSGGWIGKRLDGAYCNWNTHLPAHYNLQHCTRLATCI